MLDCVIRGGTVIDGTGRPCVQADVGLKDGKIVEIGHIHDDARRFIDAEGYVVGPGFVDVHTHYDAQVMWDPALTPSSLHGVTTVLAGNCGFTIAPVAEESVDYIMRMLACVEGMPIEALQAGLKFTWRSYAEWTAQLEGKVGLNCGFLAGHSTIRRLALGEDWRRPASAAETAKMAQLVDETVRAGALGFSSSWGLAHADHEGTQVPSRFAEQAELEQLATVLRGRPGTMLEFVPPRRLQIEQRGIEAMAAMSAAAQKPLNWNILTVSPGIDDEAIAQRLSASDYAAARGGRVVALVLPMLQQMRHVPLTTMGFNSLPVWDKVFALPPEQRRAKLRDPQARAQMREALVGRDQRHLFRFHTMTVESAATPSLQPYQGRMLADIAAERGCSAVEVFFDFAAEDLRTSFLTEPGGDDADSWRRRAALWRDPRALIGASDAGAHLDMLTTFGYFTDLIGPSVRDRGLLSMEEAVYRLTDQPARFYGLKGRGRLAPGWQADIVVFDPATVRNGPVSLRNDLPGAQARVYAGAIGVERVLVNGVEICVHGALTGATPGIVLRSGHDTAERA